MKLHLAPITCLLSLVLPMAATGQEPKSDPAFYQSALINSHSRLIVQAKALFGIEASFSNLGEIGYPTDESDDGDLLEYYFNDGYINLLDDSSTLTSDFQFEMDNAQVNLSGLVESFTLSRYRSTATDEIFNESPDSKLGWEIAYQYEWGSRKSKLRWGIVTGVALNDMDFNTTQTINGEMYIQTAQITFTNPSISYVSGETYYGSADGPMISLQDNLVMDLSQESLVYQDVWQGDPVLIASDVTSRVNMDGILANLRIGPTVNYAMNDRLHLQGGIGVSYTYFSYNVSVWESLNNTLLNSSYTEYDDQTQGQWLPGYYIESALYYSINERTSLFSSLQIQGLDNPGTGSVEDVQYDVDLNGTYSISVGLNMAF